jgi:cyclase
MSGTKRKMPKSRCFTFEQVADGVFAAIADLDRGGFGNAGVIDLGNQTVIFDTGETPISGQDLKTAAEELTGRPATCVINSHAHPDHWFGNQVFGADAAVIATHSAREQMLDFVEDVQELKKDASELEEMLQRDREKLEQVIDARQNRILRQAIARMENTLASLPILDLKLPTLTFDGCLALFGSERMVQLQAQGAGHSSGDCYLVLPQENIAFLGDLAFFQRQPFMADCDPDAWVAQLEELETREAEVLVPGHGPIGSRKDLALEKEYIVTLKALITGSVKGEEPIDKALERLLPPPFDEWSVDGTPLEPNVRFLYDWLSE